MTTDRGGVGPLWRGATLVLGEPAAVAAASAQAPRLMHAGAGGRRVLSVDEDTKRVEIESYLVRAGHGEEGEEKQEGVEGGVLSRVPAPPFLGRRLAKRAGPE
jgi:hypothetical protein